MTLKMMNCLHVLCIPFLMFVPTLSAHHEGSEDENPWVHNLFEKFIAMDTRVSSSTYLGIRNTNNIIPDIYYSTKTDVSYQQILAYLGISDQGKLAGISHFQSIVRLPEHVGLGKYLVITGSNCINDISQMFIVKMKNACETGSGPFAPNISNGIANFRDKVMKKINLDVERWHAGGASAIGKYLIVPIEGKGARILFFDMSNPEEPQQLPHVIRKSGILMAAAITKLPNNHFLIAANDAGNSFHFYYSKDKSIDSDWHYLGKILAPEFTPGKNYQNATFVTDQNGTLFLICTENTGKLPPVLNGEDCADIFRIFYAIEGIEQKICDTTTQMPIVPQFLYRKHMYCSNNQCNFAAGATMYVANPHNMYMYAVPHWLSNDGKEVRFNQYT